MSKENTATMIKKLSGFRGDARLYRLSVPLVDEYSDDDASYEYVVVSATVAYSGAETYIFGANESGDIEDWQELPGSFRGSLDHAEALRRAGYIIKGVQG